MDFVIMEKAGQRLVVNQVAVEETKQQGWVIIRTAADAGEDPWKESATPQWISGRRWTRRWLRLRRALRRDEHPDGTAGGERAAL